MITALKILRNLRFSGNSVTVETRIKDRLSELTYSVSGKTKLKMEGYVLMVFRIVLCQILTFSAHTTCF